MKERALQVTLREWQAEMSNPVVWVVMIAVGLVLAISGAFGTDAFMRPLALGLYWIAVVCVTYAVGSLVSVLCRHAMTRRNRWLRIGVTGVTIGLAVFTIIVGLNLALFGPIYDTLLDLISFAGTVVTIGCLITLVLDIAFSTKDAKGAEQAPALLDRLAFDKRAALVAISVEDHYVRIRTTKGEEMILMRLSDAIRETTPTDGMQVHRSHWVAKAAITGARRSGSGAILTMSHGPDIPVSRANIPTLRETGLLP